MLGGALGICRLLRFKSAPSQETPREVGLDSGMAKKRPSKDLGVGHRINADWASIFLGVGLGLTLALEIDTMSSGDWAGVYPTITSVSRLAALIGSYFALVGLVFVARIPWIEKSVGHDKLVKWHRKLGPWSLYLIFFHVLLVGLGYAGVDRVSTASELWLMTL